MDHLKRASGTRPISAASGYRDNNIHRGSNRFRPVQALVLALFLLTACAPVANPVQLPAQPVENLTGTEQPLPTAQPTRPAYPPGTLVEYTAQMGDTLPALAAHFNTTEAEIRAANSILPEHVTTLPAGLPMQIPIYYEPFWGSPFQVLPDSHFVNGPAQVGFDVIAYVNEQPGWLKNASQYVANEQRRGGEITVTILGDDLVKSLTCRLFFPGFNGRFPHHIQHLRRPPARAFADGFILFQTRFCVCFKRCLRVLGGHFFFLCHRIDPDKSAYRKANKDENGPCRV